MGGEERNNFVASEDGNPRSEMVAIYVLKLPLVDEQRVQIIAKRRQTARQKWWEDCEDEGHHGCSR